MSAATSAGRLRAVRLPDLPRSVWLVESGMLLNAIGTGVVMPFLIIYLRDVRGFPLSTAGFVSGAFAVAGLAATFAAGPAVDRFGDRTVLIGALLLLAGGYASLGAARVPWQAFACTIVAGVGNGAAWPAQSVLLVRLVPQEQRHVVFSLNRVAGNLGVGVGALLGGALVAGGAAGRFELLFLIDGASFALFALCALTVAPREEQAGPAAAATKGSYRAVLRDRPYLGVLAVNVLFVVCGFAPLEAAIPYFAKHEAHAGSLIVSAVFLANTLGVVALQLPIAHAVAGARRTRSLALAGVIWAGALAAVPLAATLGAAAAAVLVAAAGAIALAECLHGATLTPFAADLAPGPLRGRYLALVTSSWAIGFSLGPPLAGLLLALSPFAVWPVVAAGCLAASGIALALERRVPTNALRTPDSA